jgi:ectoine hydroxylase-related dioxygenase (phytanoyl-CoA dioxygenase family)
MIHELRPYAVPGSDGHVDVMPWSVHEQPSQRQFTISQHSDAVLATRYQLYICVQNSVQRHGLMFAGRREHTSEMAPRHFIYITKHTQRPKAISATTLCLNRSLSVAVGQAKRSVNGQTGQHKQGIYDKKYHRECNTDLLRASTS